MPDDAPFRLPGSFQQAWLHGASAPCSAFPVEVAWRLRGPLEEALLQAALTRLAERHEALRTTLAPVGDGVEQVVSARPSLPLRQLDCAPARRRRLLGRQLRAELREPFRVHADPLARATLFRLGADDHLLLLVVHHAVSDGSSRRLLQQELPALLLAEDGGAPPPPEPALQGGDVAAWERTLTALPEWLERVPPSATRPALAGERPRWTVADGYRGRFTPLSPLSPPRVARLRALCAELRAPLTAGLVAVGAAAVAQLAAGRPRFAFMRGNRDRPELRGTVGLLAEPQPLPLAADAAGSWPELIELARDALLDAGRRYHPLGALRELFEGRDAVIRNHPFDLLVNYVPRAAGRPAPVVVAVGPLRVSPLELELTRTAAATVAARSGRASFGLLDLLLVEDERGGLRGDVFSNARALDGALPERLAASFSNQFEALVTTQQQRPLQAVSRPVG